MYSCQRMFCWARISLCFQYCCRGKSSYSHNYSLTERELSQSAAIRKYTNISYRYLFFKYSHFAKCTYMPCFVFIGIHKMAKKKEQNKKKQQQKKHLPSFIQKMLKIHLLSYILYNSEIAMGFFQAWSIWIRALFDCCSIICKT